MTHTLLLARNTFREAVRDRVLGAILVFGGAFVASSVLVAPLTLGEHERVVRDLGLSAINLFSILVIVLVGTSLVYREIERRTIHTILAHPVGRPQFIVGKFLGMYGTILATVVVLGAMYAGVVAVFGGGTGRNILVALGLVALEGAIVTAIAVFFSSVASPILSAVFTALVYGAGHLAAGLKALAHQADARLLEAVATFFYALLPSLHGFHVRNNLLSDVPIPWAQVLWCAGYTVLYTVAVLSVTILAFERRDFE